MSPIQQMLLGAGGAVATKTYVDDVFSTYVYTGTGSTRSINNGIDLSDEEGMVWTKVRNQSYGHFVFDTLNGNSKYLRPDNTDAHHTYPTSGTNAGITAFNNNGYSLGADQSYQVLNYASNDYASWTFRKAPGFFDVVTWTGDGSSNRQISHSLSSIPGLIIIKRTNGTAGWVVYHRSTGASKGLYLNSTNAAFNTSNCWNSTEPTASVFTLGGETWVNANNDEFVAYVFAGGESTAATARSVDFDGTGDYLVTNTSSDYDFGTGDFTVEHWIRPDSFTTAQIIDARATGDTSGSWCTYITTDNTYRFNKDGDQITSTAKLSIDEWTHCAVVRNSGTTTLYINGVSQGTYNDTNDYDDDRIVMGIHGPNLSSFPFNGQLSNVRVVKGTAVYTSSFRPPTEPLTNITNTKLLCCNNSSVTGTTTGTVTSGGDPTASTDSPFDDPAGFVFGDAGDQNVIKCGSYVGNGSATAGPEVNLGWEPQWLLIKDTTAGDTQDWILIDSMRGFIDGSNDQYLMPNATTQELNYDYGALTSTGFKLKQDNDAHNGDGRTYIYMAIRRPDGYVGKPPELGTGVFAMDTGIGSSTIPNFDSGFPVDFAFYKHPASTGDFWVNARLMQGKELKTNSSDAESTYSGGVFDSNTGWNTGQASSAQSWMWKRHAGFDVVTYKGDGVAGRQISHSLNKTVEMIWVKRRTGSATDWMVYHKNANGGTNPEQYYLKLNTDSDEATGTPRWNDTAPTSTHFTLGSTTVVNGSGKDFIAMLFASVDGISKVGYYTGTGNAVSVTTGFQPRFYIIKRSDAGSSPWYVVDSLRGMSNSGDEKGLQLENSQAQFDYNFGTTSSTGFTITATHASLNTNGGKYIYYCHA